MSGVASKIVVAGVITVEPAGAFKVTFASISPEDLSTVSLVVVATKVAVKSEDSNS